MRKIFYTILLVLGLCVTTQAQITLPWGLGTVDNGTVTFSSAVRWYADLIPPTEDGTAGQTIQTDGANTLSFGDPSGAINIFEIDDSGDLMPRTAVGVSDFYEYDGNDDVMPKL